eukprot:SAG11_NODE_28_length_23154_cov_11.023856_1_plen_66_part_10
MTCALMVCSDSKLNYEIVPKANMYSDDYIGVGSADQETEWISPDRVDYNFLLEGRFTARSGINLL